MRQLIIISSAINDLHVTYYDMNTEVISTQIMLTGLLHRISRCGDHVRNNAWYGIIQEARIHKDSIEV